MMITIKSIFAAEFCHTRKTETRKEGRKGKKGRERGKEGGREIHFL